MLDRNEKMLCADALNGCYMDRAADDLGSPETSYLAMMAGDGGSIRGCSGLEHEIADAIQLNMLDRKWQVDGNALLRKLRAMLPENRAKLVRCIAGCWQRNDANFERDLEALEV